MLEAGDGAEIIVGRRGSHAQALWRRAASGVFGAIVLRRHGSRLVGTHSVFSIISRRAVERYLRHEERLIMYLPVLEALGMPITSFDYHRDARVAGRSAYGALGLLRRAWRVLTTRPVKPRW